MTSHFLVCSNIHHWTIINAYERMFPKFIDNCMNSCKCYRIAHVNDYRYTCMLQMSIPYKQCLLMVHHLTNRSQSKTTFKTSRICTTAGSLKARMLIIYNITDERVHNAWHQNTWPSILPSHKNKNCFPWKLRTLLYYPYSKKSVKTKWRTCYVK